MPCLCKYVVEHSSALLLLHNMVSILESLFLFFNSTWCDVSMACSFCSQHGVNAFRTLKATLVAWVV